MDIQSAMLEVIIAVEKEIKALFFENGFKTEKLGAFGDTFYSELDKYLTDGGKRVRPFLTKTAFDAVSGADTEGNIFRAALAIELLHNGSLLHDDVIDKDETRRGKPSFHVVFRELYNKRKNDSQDKANDFGEAMSIFAGDICFPYAIESIIQSGFPSELALKALHAFSQGFKDVIDGVIIETGDTVEPNSTRANYDKMVYLKTGALIRKAVEIGAILGRGSDSQIKALTDYCIGIGKAFQIQDDILGIFGDPDELGKPVGGDIRENKQTILRIITMENANEEQKQKLSSLMGKEEITDQELEEIKKLFTDTGALKAAFDLIEQATDDAKNALELASPPLKIEPKLKL
ncbi:MAG: polyprenyl synthetase family protein, partial [Candidatus Thorarchaeota archaeon]